jgi:type III restriction enzyme
MKADIEEVIVYGKIPAKSICIPTVASSNYSPDFMYVVRRRNGSKELNVIIETKAYDQEAQVSQDEEAKITCAEAFFKEMTAKGFTVHFRKQINSKSVKEIINDLIKG